MTLEELIRDIHTLNRELESCESKYGLLSKDFYDLYTSGQLPDEEVEQIDEFGRGAAIYKIKLEREADYEKLVQKRLASFRVLLPLGQAFNPGTQADGLFGRRTGRDTGV